MKIAIGWVYCLIAVKKRSILDRKYFMCYNLHDSVNLSMEDKVKHTGIKWQLFLTMLKIGLFTFGGGHAMIALLENELVSRKHWLDKDEFLDVVAIAESTPGPIAINAATYIGYKLAGFFGSVAGTIGVCIPSFVIIYIISLFLDTFLTYTLVEYAFRGIQVCVVYLILSVGIKMFKGMKKNGLNIAFFTCVLACIVTFSLLSIKFSTIFYILITGGIGVILYLVSKLCEKKGTDK